MTQSRASKCYFSIYFDEVKKNERRNTKLMFVDADSFLNNCWTVPGAYENDITIRIFRNKNKQCLRKKYNIIITF